MREPTHASAYFAALRPLRFLAIPVAVALLILTGLGASAQDRRTALLDEEDERAEPLNGQPASEDPSGEQAAQPADGEGTGSDLEVASAAGQVGVELGGEVAVARAKTDDGKPGPEVALTAGPTGMRLVEGGGLEPVDQGEIIQPGDIVLASAGGGGLDVLGPGGARVEVRTTDQGLDITEVSPDGARSPIEPDPNGQIDVGDGVTLQVPVNLGAPGGETGSGSDAEAQASEEPTIDGRTRWILLALLALALAAVAGAFVRRRRRQDEPFGANFVGPAGIPADRFEEFAAMLAADHDPARAIRLAFYAAERGLGRLPPRHSTETPFEWYGRVIAKHDYLAAPLGTLCDRFAATRFSPDEPTLANRDEAVSALMELNQLARGLRLETPDQQGPKQQGPKQQGPDQHGTGQYGAAGGQLASNNTVETRR